MSWSWSLDSSRSLAFISNESFPKLSLAILRCINFLGFLSAFLRTLISAIFSSIPNLNSSVPSYMVTILLYKKFSRNRVLYNPIQHISNQLWFFFFQFPLHPQPLQLQTPSVDFSIDHIQNPSISQNHTAPFQNWTPSPPATWKNTGLRRNHNERRQPGVHSQSIDSGSNSIACPFMKNQCPRKLGCHGDHYLSIYHVLWSTWSM